MKKILAVIFALVLVISCAAVPAFAKKVQSGSVDASKLPAGTLIYYEDFEDIEAQDTDSAIDALGWTKSEDFKEFTAQLKVADGRLYIDNLDSTVGTSNDSYATIMSSDYLAKVCNKDYTYQYDVTYRDAENTYRYVSLLCNYDGTNNYNTVDMRIRGDGYNQTRHGDSWVHYNNDNEFPICTRDNTAILTQLFGDTFDENVPALKDRTITVRVETSIEKGPTVYVNGIRVSEMTTNTDLWNTIDSYAIAFKTSTKLLAEMDNFMVWTGIGVEPDMTPVTPQIEEEADAAVDGEEAPAAAESAPAAAATAAQTSDTSVMLTVVLALSAAVLGFATLKARKTN